MRKLTLNEKISIKGILSKRWNIQPLPRLTMSGALHFWAMCGGKSIAQYFKFH